MGENDVLLLGGQVGECRGVAGGEAGMIEALVAGVGGFVLGIIQVQVVEQAPPGGGIGVQTQKASQSVGTVSHKQGVIQGGDGTVVFPSAHHPYLVGVQQFTGQFQKFMLTDFQAHWNQSFPGICPLLKFILH